MLANFAFLSRADNREIGGAAPSIYRAKMPTDVSMILKSAVTSKTPFPDNFGMFINERALMLALAAAKLCDVKVSTSIT